MSMPTPRAGECPQQMSSSPAVRLHHSLLLHTHYGKGTAVAGCRVTCSATTALGSSVRFMCAQAWNCWLIATRETKDAMPRSSDPGVQRLIRSHSTLNGTVGLNTCGDEWLTLELVQARRDHHTQAGNALLQNGGRLREYKQGCTQQVTDFYCVNIRGKATGSSCGFVMSPMWSGHGADSRGNNLPVDSPPPTLCTLLANSRSVMVQGRWWWPWKAAIWSPTIGVAPLP